MRLWTSATSSKWALVATFMHTVLLPMQKGLAFRCPLAEAGQAWCNVTAPMDVRVANLVSRLTFVEKVQQLQTQQQQITNKFIPECIFSVDL